MTDNYDIIGDIHGRAQELEDVLAQLGYVDGPHGYAHPDGRKAVFLGDFIDRGTGHKSVLTIVREMVENGQAQAIMGNHEFNAICFATEVGDGEYARKHTERNVSQHQLFLNEYPLGSPEHDDVIEFFKSLPVYIDFGAFRVIHACWDDDKLDTIEPYLDANARFDEKTYAHYGAKLQPLFDAVDSVLKSPEFDLPDGVSFQDMHGISRTKTRVLWWRDPALNVSERLDMRFSVNEEQKDIIDGHEGLRSTFMRAAVPTFIGHYALTYEGKPEFTDSVAVLDYKDKVTGYRWNKGDTEFSPHCFVFSP